jgi:hypothetical protein
MAVKIREKNGERSMNSPPKTKIVKLLDGTEVEIRPVSRLQGPRR